MINQLIDRMDEKVFDLFSQQKHLMVLGDCCKCTQQLP